jgi:hypothetical protein
MCKYMSGYEFYRSNCFEELKIKNNFSPYHVYFKTSI